MGIRTAEEYKASLRDGRCVYIRGEKVEDITRHPILGVTCDTIAAGYELTASADSAIRDLFVAPHRKPVKPINRYFVTPRNKEDLVNRTRMIQRSIEMIGGLPFGKDIGTDCLNAAFVVAGQMGKPVYQKNAMDFLEHLRKNDLHTCGAVTCVKGDRSKEPAKQKHPDYYLHVVDRNSDGIVVKGAKIHITSAPAANEIIVVPTRQMRENEGDYAVSFAIPANTPGITFICRGGRGAWSDHEFHPDRPVRELTEAMIVFDNVFVPWERVFICGEWQYSMLLAYTFATFHRFTAISYKVPAVEVMAGCAVAMAKYNGLYKVSHIMDKLADIAAYVETSGPWPMQRPRIRSCTAISPYPTPSSPTWQSSISPANTTPSWSSSRISPAASSPRPQTGRIGGTPTSTPISSTTSAVRKSTAPWTVSG
jgi:4-hydroxybutyryl-CoA dehydratase/vinylacetyl-CoA-Delta-isomerase